jgi:hypothetical protein
MGEKENHKAWEHYTGVSNGHRKKQ